MANIELDDASLTVEQLMQIARERGVKVPIQEQRVGHAMSLGTRIKRMRTDFNGHPFGLDLKC